MADGHIKIQVEVDGRQVEVASKELDNLGKSGQESGKGVKETEESLKRVDRESGKAGGSIRKFATSLGLVAIGAAAFATLRGAMDSAISRFDTLNSFPKVLEALGVSAEDAQSAMDKLSDGIDGLPTKLDDIASTAQRMYTSFGDMDKAADTAIALNNALLGSGSSAEQASRGTEQYLKVLQTGQMDLMTWRSLSETMDVGLVKIAEGFGYAGKSAKDDLYNALKEGHVTIDQFNNKMIELGTGTGIMAKLAKENSLGLATSLTNLRTAVSRNLANVIEAFNDLTREVTGKEIAEHIDGLKVLINQAFRVITNVIRGAAPVVIFFANAIGATIPVVQALTPVLAGLLATYLSFVVLTKITALVAGFTTTVSISTVVIGGATKVITALRVALAALTGPIGWISLGIGAIAAGAVAVVKWFKRTTDEAKKLNKQVDELADSNEQLSKSVESNAKSYENSQKQIKTNTETHKELIRQIDELSKKENKSAGDKKLLQSYVEDLNNSIDDLNLVYGEESDALSMSSEQLMKRVELMEQEARMQSSQERLKQTIEEQIEIERQLAEVNELREEWNEKLEDGSVKSREHKKALEELEEQELELMETLQLSKDERVKADQELAESAEMVAQLTKEATGRQKLLYEELSESQQQAVDGMKGTWKEYYDYATEMFTMLTDEMDLTAKDFIETLEENQRIVGEWAENIETLATRGVDQGLLDKLREAGPESAGYVKALVNSSDDELKRLNDVFSKGGETAKKALSKAFEIDSGVLSSVEHLVINTERSLREQIQNADFEGLGQNVADSTAGGIEKGTPKAERASQNLARGISKSFENEAEIRSPSRVFEEHGENLTEGLTLGMNNGTSKVINKAKEIATSTIEQYDNFRQSFVNIGSNAMSGLNAGLNAGRQRVLNTARSIANQVAGTMQSALRIQSPSQIMRDDVGKWIPEGVALGIEDNASSIFKTIDDISNKMMRFTNPELALGASMGYSGRLGNSISNTSTNNVQNSNQTVNMEGMFNGANFNVRDEQDIESLAKELGDYITGKARSRGVVMR